MPPFTVEPPEIAEKKLESTPVYARAAVLIVSSIIASIAAAANLRGGDVFLQQIHR